MEKIEELISAAIPILNTYLYDRDLVNLLGVCTTLRAHMSRVRFTNVYDYKKVKHSGHMHQMQNIRYGYDYRLPIRKIPERATHLVFLNVSGSRGGVKMTIPPNIKHVEVLGGTGEIVGGSFTHFVHDRNNGHSGIYIPKTITSMTHLESDADILAPWSDGSSVPKSVKFLKITKAQYPDSPYTKNGTYVVPEGVTHLTLSKRYNIKLPKLPMSLVYFKYKRVVYRGSEIDPFRVHD